MIQRVGAFFFDANELKNAFCLPVSRETLTEPFGGNDASDGSIGAHVRNSKQQERKYVAQKAAGRRSTEGN